VPPPRAESAGSSRSLSPRGDAHGSRLGHDRQQQRTGAEDAANALEHCRTPAALDWIERTIAQPKLAAPFWGELAAKSVLPWPRAQQWLALGRPLSLVALDALQVIARLRDTKTEFNNVRLTEVADRGDVVDALRAYGESAPKVPCQS
jgi:hypothetical protein